MLFYRIFSFSLCLLFINSTIYGQQILISDEARKNISDALEMESEIVEEKVVQLDLRTETNFCTVNSQYLGDFKKTVCNSDDAKSYLVAMKVEVEKNDNPSLKNNYNINFHPNFDDIIMSKDNDLSYVERKFINDTVQVKWEQYGDTGFRRYGHLAKQTIIVVGVMISFLGLLMMAPYDVSQWKDGEKPEDLEDAIQNWKDKTASGWTWDKDNWIANLVAHTYTGSSYYTLARHNNLSFKESCGYAGLLSTFAWEQGLEATVEQPSIADFWITWLGGCALGEALIRAENTILKNGKKIFGQKWLGKTALFFIDPFGGISNLIYNGIDRFAGNRNREINISTHVRLGAIENIVNDVYNIDPVKRKRLPNDMIGVTLDFKF